MNTVSAPGEVMIPGPLRGQYQRRYFGLSWPAIRAILVGTVACQRACQPSARSAPEIVLLRILNFLVNLVGKGGKSLAGCRWVIVTMQDRGFDGKTGSFDLQCINDTKCRE
ncbi:cell surface receptor/MFS transporter [Aspergillus luchuensis]|uniref:Cell surface receptor/MFS transporter n=1 Tax=Aspergillus kawachii TaxID=1069201 RepID=A0A146FWA4_ASPKA|nr:cell surface receptor/MFS transporter [Aspergillus luchuensis]